MSALKQIRAKWFESIDETSVPALEEHLLRSRKKGMHSGLLVLVVTGLISWSYFDRVGEYYWHILGGIVGLSLVLHAIVALTGDRWIRQLHEAHISLVILFLSHIGWVAPDSAVLPPLFVFLAPMGVLIFSPLPPSAFLYLWSMTVASEFFWGAWYGAPWHRLLNSFSLASVIAVMCMGSTQFIRNFWKQIQEAQDQKMAAERLEVLGQHTAGVAHEMKTPLATALNEAHNLRELFQEMGESIGHPDVEEADLREINQEMIEHLQHLTQGLERAAGFVKALRDHTQEFRETEVESFLVRDVLQGAFLETDPQGVDVDVLGVPSDLQIVGDARSLEQVFFNLLSNAIRASVETKGPGLVVVEAESIRDETRVRVRDNGPGVPPELRERIFEPLFTTRTNADDTGLGLSVCRDIVQGVFGGKLQLIPSEKGACFEVTLPHNTRKMPSSPREPAYAPFMEQGALSIPQDTPVSVH